MMFNRCTPQIVTAAACAAWALASHAGQGLAAPQAEAWWPQWQARLSLQAASVVSTHRSSSVGAAGGLAAPGSAQLAAQGGIKSAALLGDYYFARPLSTYFSGHVRASGGLMVGALGAAPISFDAPQARNAGGSAAPRLGLALMGSSAPPWGMLGVESAEPVPYLGLGYSGSLWRDSISLTADLGLVSERPTAAGNVGRALFGNQGMNQALRDMRLSPVLQLGMRYAF